MKISRLSLPSLAALAGGILLAQTTPPPAAETWVGTGFDYSRGRYGLATATEVFSVPVELNHVSGPWIFRAIASWLKVTGPSAAALTGGGPGALTRPTSASESGPGDLYLDATYRAGAVAGDVQLDTTARVKLPTADEARGLGTGEVDYYAQLTASRTLGATTPFATLGYRVLGDSPRYQLRDGPYAGVGAHFRTGEHTVVTASVDWRSRLVADGEAGTEATLAITHDLSPRWRMMAYASAGFTDASPDAAGGLRVNYRF